MYLEPVLNEVYSRITVWDGVLAISRIPSNTQILNTREKTSRTMSSRYARDKATMLETSPDNLTQSIETLYQTFSGYAFRPDMSCCIPHCFDQSEIDYLGSRPLRELTAEELSSFTSDLLLTCGEVPDFKYFLPRIFGSWGEMISPLVE